MPKFKHKEGKSMLCDKILEHVCAETYIQNLPIGQQSEIIDVIEHVFEKLKEEYPYATITELLSDVSK